MHVIVPFRGVHPRIGEGVLVAPGSWVIGDVVLEDGVSIWFNCTLRGDVERIHIGRDSNIQDGSVLHTDRGYPCVVGREVVVGHGVILHGARVGDGVLIGMGATVLSGAVIGAGAIVAAGALVPEGMTIPDGMLALGVPARVVRPVKPEEKERIEAGARAYAERRDHVLREPWMAQRGSGSPFFLTQ